MFTKTPRAALAAVLLIALSLPLAAAGDEHGVGGLHVVVTGFRSTDGDLAIALFASEDDYQEQTNAVRREWLSVDGDEVTWALSGLAPGEYAVIAYHDENGNRELDFRILGIPKEPVGVSNNARAAFGPPGFRAAKFEVRAGDVAEQHVRLR
jgi:uncharacterized protein (DUF2141 family)